MIYSPANTRDIVNVEYIVYCIRFLLDLKIRKYKGIPLEPLAYLYLRRWHTSLWSKMQVLGNLLTQIFFSKIDH